MDIKVAILSLHQADNYGAVLQNFALQKAINKLGVSCVTLDYDDQNIKQAYAVNFLSNGFKGIHKITGNISNVINYRQSKIHRKNFQEFRENNLKLTKLLSEKELLECDDSNTVFVCGSDQVWNSEIVKAAADIYTLQFINKSKKASYAASAGNPNNITEEMLENIRKMDLITVRENELKKHLHDCGIKNVMTVCDPVFLLNKEEWACYLPQKLRVDKYLFLYCIGNKARESRDLAKYIAKKNIWKLLFATKRDKNMLFGGKCIYSDGPFDFLEDIANAQFVVASSFHAVAFSIIFEKEFAVILHESTGGRMTNLLEELGLSERIVSNVQEYIEKSKFWKPIDYEIVKNKLDIIQKYSYEQLHVICNLNKK